MTSSHINCRTHTYTHTETAKEKALVERKQTAVKTKIHITDEHRTKRRRTNQRARESERAALAHPEVTHIYIRRRRGGLFGGTARGRICGLREFRKEEVLRENARLGMTLGGEENPLVRDDERRWEAERG